ncbi:MAG: hypothetical protein R6V57_06035 [Vicinamibacterales bacterium]
MSPKSRIGKRQLDQIDAVLAEVERLVGAARSSIRVRPPKPGLDGGKPCGGKPCEVLPDVAGMLHGVEIDLGGKPCGGGKPCSVAPKTRPKTGR